MTNDVSLDRQNDENANNKCFKIRLHQIAMEKMFGSGNENATGKQHRLLLGVFNTFKDISCQNTMIQYKCLLISNAYISWRDANIVVGVSAKWREVAQNILEGLVKINPRRRHSCEGSCSVRLKVKTNQPHTSSSKFRTDL